MSDEKSSEAVATGISGQSFPITVDPSTTLQEYIEAGDYIRVHAAINHDVFPDRPDWFHSDAVLVHLGHTASTEEVLEYLDQHSLQPALMIELAAFGEQHLMQRQAHPPVVALGGTVWRDANNYRRIGAIWSHHGHWEFRLGYPGRPWSADCYFLATPRKRTMQTDRLL